MARLRVLVADDEAPARRVLARLLAAHHDIHVVAECADGVDTALRIRHEHQVGDAGRSLQLGVHPGHLSHWHVEMRPAADERREPLH